MRKNNTVPNKEVDMTSIADVSVCIQTGSRVDPLDALLVRGGRPDHPLSTPRKASFLLSAEPRALGPPPFRALRSHRFSRRAPRLPNPRRTHARGVLCA